MQLANPDDLINDCLDILLPPKRYTVPEAAEKYVVLNTPGGFSGPFRNPPVHYMVEPAELLTSRQYDSVIFVGPAQTGKTQMLVDNWIAHTVVCDPVDMMVVQTAQDTARDYSRRRVDRQLDNCPEVKAQLKPLANADNTHDKYFRSGMILSLGWPTKNQLAGKPIGKMALTDYDRMPEDVDGDGPAFALAMKRSTTFGSRAMTLAESSPSRPIMDPKWKPDKTRPHEAPPTTGILGLFNTGDRRRSYCQCPHCREYFMPACSIDAMHIPDSVDVEMAAAEACLICTACGTLIGQEYERDIKRSHRWVCEGQSIDCDGVITGKKINSKRASFWLPGWFAAYQSWRSIVSSYLKAKKQFDSTGDEQALKGCVNLDIGGPYLSISLEEQSSALDLMDRADSMDRGVVPHWVRFLTAAVDVQKNRFVVQVQGVGVGIESGVIDRFSIHNAAERLENGEPDLIRPGAYPEDWDVLIDKVINKTYPLDDDSGRAMPVHIIACDSGGEEGVTDNALKFYRRLKKRRLHNKFLLVKGDGNLNAPRVKKTYPDNTNRKDRSSSAAGDVPLFRLNSNVLKDTVHNMLNRAAPGPGYFHLPDWLGEWWYQEIDAEIRHPDGKWKNIGNRSNETVDLLYYNRALLVHLAVEQIDWDNLSAKHRRFALPWDDNPLLAQEPKQPKTAVPQQGRRVRFNFN